MAVHSSRYHYNLLFQKGISLAIAAVCFLHCLTDLLGSETAAVPDNTTTLVTVGRHILWLPDKFAYYMTRGLELSAGLVALAAFRWLHLRVRRVTGSKLGLLVLSEPARAVAWSEIQEVRKAFGSFYLIRFTDGTQLHAPIEHEPPATLAAVFTYGEQPTALEQLSRQHGVWVG